VSDAAVPALFTRMAPGARLGTTLGWLRYALGQLPSVVRGPRRRFVRMTPPLFAHQRIYDRKQHAVLRLRVRDMVDVEVMRLVFDDDDYGLDKLSRGAELSACYERLVADGLTPLILDCGANSGMASAYFTATYPAARIVAIEPEPDNLALARINNPHGGVHCLLAAVGPTDGRGRIVDPGDGNWAYRVEDAADGAVRIVSINQLLAEHCDESTRPFIAKIDIEGGEAALFLANTEWIDRFPLLVIELHDWMLPGTANARAFLREISRRDRDFVYWGENVFSIANGLG
jgi:FkbM family methyltransferase